MNFKMEPISSSLRLVTQGQGLDSSATYVNTYHPSHITYGPTLCLHATDDYDTFRDSLLLAKRQTQSISLCFRGGAECAIFSDPCLRNDFRAISTGIEGITVDQQRFSPDHSPAEIQTPTGRVIITQRSSVEALRFILHSAKKTCIDLRFSNYVLTRDLLPQFVELFQEITPARYLSVTNIICPPGVLGTFFSDIAGFIPNIRYLDVSQNIITTSVADGLYRFITSHVQLVYLDISDSNVHTHGFNRILDSCEANTQVQVLIAERTCDASEPAIQSLETRLSCGDLTLLDVVLDEREGHKALKQRLSPFFSRNAMERLALDSIARNSIIAECLPIAILSISQGKNGINNLYTCIRINHNEIFSRLLYT
jgi:hypothetical protein